MEPLEPDELTSAADLSLPAPVITKDPRRAAGFPKLRFPSHIWHREEVALPLVVVPPASTSSEGEVTTTRAYILTEFLHRSHLA
jgi:hypothetical protein